MKTSDSSSSLRERPLRHDWLVWFCQSFFVLMVLAQLGILIYFCFYR